MALFAISDLHLSLGAADKPMDIFGPAWANYMDRLTAAWRKVVGPEDTVIMPGDLGWAMTLGEAEPDFRFLDTLPGEKILGKGNHDYWWTSVSKMCRSLEAWTIHRISFLHNNAYAREGWAVCGTRGWIGPGEEGFTEADGVVYRRELERLSCSLAAGRELVASGGARAMMAALHYPPFDTRGAFNEYAEIMAAQGVALCVYGHLHTGGARHAMSGEYGGVSYKPISADLLEFVPWRIEPPA